MNFFSVKGQGTRFSCKPQRFLLFHKRFHPRMFPAAYWGLVACESGIMFCVLSCLCVCCVYVYVCAVVIGNNYIYIQGLGTDESTLIEILCTRSNDEIQELKRQYKSGEWGSSVGE